MKTIIVIALIFAVAFAQQQNYEKCAQDSLAFAKTAQAFYQTYQSGDRSLSDLIPEVQAIVNQGKALFVDCGINQQINLNPSVSENCLTDIKSLADLCEKAYNDYQQKNIFALVQDAVAIVKEGEQTLADCKTSTLSLSQQAPNYPECAKDAVIFGQDLYNFIELIKNNGTSNIPLILSDVEKILQDAQNLISDCDIPVSKEWLQPTESAQCKQDIEDLAKLAAQAIADYEKKNIAGLVKVAVEIVKEANKTLEDCKSTLANFVFKLPYQDKINYEKCAKDAYTFGQACYTFYNAVKNGSSMEVIISDINAMVQDAQSLITDCGLNITISDYPPADPGVCAGDLISLAQLAFSTVQDIESAQWQALPTDVVSILAQGKKTINDCVQIDQAQIEEDNQNLFNCIHSLNTFATDVQQFLNDTQDGAGFTALVHDANTVATYFPQFLTTCGATKLANEYSKYFPDVCFNDLQATADAANAIWQARSNFFNVLRLIPPLANAAEASFDDCPLLHKL